MTVMERGGRQVNNMSVHLVAHDQPAAPTDRAAIDAAWLVLEAALDLGDEAAIAACRRVIDAGLSGAPADPSDLHLVLGYFR
jgi:hypothetical protein